MSNLYLPICAVLINLLIIVVFFSKKRIKSDETKAYSLLIIIALIESSLACVLVILMNLFGIPSYIYNLHRIDYILILSWVWALFNYVLIVSLTNKKKRLIRKIATIVIAVIYSIAIIMLNENVISDLFLAALLIEAILVSPFMYKVFNESYNNYKKV